jgi:hypothetical protein
MPWVKGLPALYKRAQTIEAELARITDQLQGLGFNEIFDDDAPPPLPLPPLPQSKYRGVSWFKKRGKWGAVINDTKLGPFKGLGCFKKQKDAARAFDKAARKRGYASEKLNFP